MTTRSSSPLWCAWRSGPYPPPCWWNTARPWPGMTRAAEPERLPRVASREMSGAFHVRPVSHPAHRPEPYRERLRKVLCTVTSGVHRRGWSRSWLPVGVASPSKDGLDQRRSLALVVGCSAGGKSASCTGRRGCGMRSSPSTLIAIGVRGHSTRACPVGSRGAVRLACSTTPSRLRPRRRLKALEEWSDACFGERHVRPEFLIDPFCPKGLAARPSITILLPFSG